MTATELIPKLLASKSYIEIFPDLSGWTSLYKTYLGLVHPDICNHPKAQDASQKLNEYKDIINKGQTHKDDAGEVKYFHNRVEITAEPNVLKHSFNNWTILKNLKGDVASVLHKMIPEKAELDGETLKFYFPHRALPISEIRKSSGDIEQKHVNWILSRMLEFSGYCHRSGYVHAGITPDSIYVVPETHGIMCISFYHMTKLNTKLSTVSSRYKFFYPPQVFSEKLAKERIDVDLCKKTAIYMYGDESGSGVKLKLKIKTGLIKSPILAYLMKQDDDSYISWKEYRALLKANFDTKQFHPYII